MMRRTGRKKEMETVKETLLCALLVFLALIDAAFLSGMVVLLSCGTLHVTLEQPGWLLGACVLAGTVAAVSICSMLGKRGGCGMDNGFTAERTNFYGIEG